jgi:hypothetical protein
MCWAAAAVIVPEPLLNDLSFDFQIVQFITEPLILNAQTLPFLLALFILHVQ